MLTVHYPRLRIYHGHARLVFPLSEDGEKHLLFAEVPTSYASYLTLDRADAALALLLFPALERHQPLHFEAPITAELLDACRLSLTPLLAQDIFKSPPITIDATPTSPVTNTEGAVSLHFTGGVDSMFSLVHLLEDPPPKPRLTHLLVADNGCLEGAPEGAFDILTNTVQRDIAEPLGLQTLPIKTNIQELYPIPWRRRSALMNAALPLALQSLISLSLIASSYEIASFRLEPANMAWYEPYVIDCIKTPATRIASDHIAETRLEKLDYLKDEPLAQRFLHPCVRPLNATNHNCGHCDKCHRTLLGLFALDALDDFASVFDVKEFYDNLDYHFARALLDANNHHTQEVLSALEAKGVTPSPKARTLAKTMTKTRDLTLQQNLFPTLSPL